MGAGPGGGGEGAGPGGGGACSRKPRGEGGEGRADPPPRAGPLGSPAFPRRTPVAGPTWAVTRGGRPLTPSEPRGVPTRGSGGLPPRTPGLTCPQPPGASPALRGRPASPGPAPEVAPAPRPPAPRPAPARPARRCGSGARTPGSAEVAAGLGPAAQVSPRAGAGAGGGGAASPWLSPRGAPASRAGQAPPWHSPPVRLAPCVPTRLPALAMCNVRSRQEAVHKISQSVSWARCCLPGPRWGPHAELRTPQRPRP